MFQGNWSLISIAQVSSPAYELLIIGIPKAFNYESDLKLVLVITSSTTESSGLSSSLFE